MLADVVAVQNRNLDSIRRQLITTGPVTLEQFEQVDRDAFEYLLRLLGEALGHRRPMETVSVRSLDGSLEIRLSPAARLDSRLIELRTDRGTLRGPAHRLEIMPIGGTA
jgi:hypothetical protein